ncbi:conserved domain protein [Actinomyces sp. oral taxon 170 str. F0386]|nr:conserved domain protein [Actinomyces sp. oral taxon 170 str. F0386]
MCDLHFSDMSQSSTYGPDPETETRVIRTNRHQITTAWTAVDDRRPTRPELWVSTGHRREVTI